MQSSPEMRMMHWHKRVYDVYKYFVEIYDHESPNLL